MNTTELQYVLDQEMLRQYIEMIGADKLLSSALMLEDKLSDYEAELNDCARAQNVVKLRHHVHQVKGAAGTLGLIRIQHTADHIQKKEHLLWQLEDEHDLKLLLRYLKEDVPTLLDYLKYQG